MPWRCTSRRAWARRRRAAVAAARARIVGLAAVRAAVVLVHDLEARAIEWGQPLSASRSSRRARATREAQHAPAIGHARAARRARRRHESAHERARARRAGPPWCRRCRAEARWCGGIGSFTRAICADELESRVHVAERAERRAAAGGDPVHAPREAPPCGTQHRRTARSALSVTTASVRMRDAVASAMACISCGHGDDIAYARRAPRHEVRDGERVRRARGADGETHRRPHVRRRAELERAHLVAAERRRDEIVALDVRA